MARRIPKRIQGILKEIQKELYGIFSNRIKKMILFGSYARGDFSQDSDIDIIIVLDKIKDINSEREKYFPIISQISLNYDIVVSIVPIDAFEFQNKNTPLILNVNREGMRI